ncbi:MAG: HEAT repeat domain-containing protein [Nitrosomonas sp.]|nr:HEAT repeat domain-containing protein [Nitrosomonas sp.]
MFSFPGTGRATVNPKVITRLVEQSAEPGNGITSEEIETAKAIQSLGSEAIPYLLPLLKHPNKSIRKLVSFTLRDISGLDESHLGALIETRIKGDGWIPPAIAKIGTPKAIVFLVDELRKEKQTQTQLTYAFVILGSKGVPYLVELIRNEPNDYELMESVLFIFGELKGKAESAVDPLIEIITNYKSSEQSKAYSVLALGEIGEQARRSVRVLILLAQYDPKAFTNVVNKSLQSMGTSEAVAGLVGQLNENPSLELFRDIASLRANGRSAGPSIVPFLRNENWDLRVVAARTIGYIGYSQAITELTDLLRTDDDWRLVYVATVSLGRLKALKAVPALTLLSETYWYPPVRKAAKESIEVITKRSENSSKPHHDNFAFEFFEYEDVGRVTSDKFQRTRVSPAFLQDDQIGSDELVRLTYKNIPASTKQTEVVNLCIHSFEEQDASRPKIEQALRLVSLEKYEEE